MRQYVARSDRSTPSGTRVSTPPSGSSKEEPKAQWASSSSSPAYTLSSGSSCGPRGSVIGRLDVRYVGGELVEGRVAVDLVATRREERVLLVRARRGDEVRADHPDADPLVAAGVDVTRVPQRHRVVRRVQGADVHVVEPPLAADEHLVERPLGRDRGHPSPP